jgi:hypothetical protein
MDERGLNVLPLIAQRLWHSCLMQAGRDVVYDLNCRSESKKRRLVPPTLFFRE